MSHAHFHAHDGRPRHVHDHEAGDYRTAHAHSTMLVAPPLIPQGSVTLHRDGRIDIVLGDLNIRPFDEKVASPPEPIRGSEK